MKVVSKKVVQITINGCNIFEGKVVVENLFMGLFPYTQNYWLMKEEKYPFLNLSRTGPYDAGLHGLLRIKPERYQDKNECYADLEKALNSLFI